MRMFVKALLNVMFKSIASKESLLNRLVFKNNYGKKKRKFVTFYSLNACMATEVQFTDIQSEVWI